jgi:hypothetical protein
MLTATSGFSSKPPCQRPTPLPLSGIWCHSLYSLHKLCTCTRSAVVTWTTQSGCQLERMYWIPLLCKLKICTRSVLSGLTFMLCILNIPSLEDFLLIKYLQMSYLQINLMKVNCINILSATQSLPHLCFTEGRRIAGY